ncbi:hypothetical protein ACRAWD_01675 [Caulobacter segnis]
MSDEVWNEVARHYRREGPGRPAGDQHQRDQRLEPPERGDAPGGGDIVGV